MPRHILTAVAWPYANGPRHIGHVSGFGVPSDVFSRYMRMAGHHVLMVSGTDEHGTPIQVQADKEGVTARELADRYNRVIVEDLRGLGLSYDLFTRTTTRNHYAVVQELFATLHRNGYIVAETTMGAISPVDRPHAARPLHRGHLPDLRLRRRPRRPVRQLRQPARPDRPDQPAQPDQRRDAGVRRDRALLPRPAGVRRGARLLAAGRASDWRPNVLKFSPQPHRRPAAARDHPRPRLGRARPAARAGRTAPTSASTSGSTRSSATCRRRSSGRGARGDPEAWREWWQNPDADVVLLHGQGQHRLPLGDLAGDAARLRRRGRPAAASPARSASWTCRPRSCRASSSPWRAASSPPRARSSSTCATSSSATTPTRCATSSPSPGPETQDTDFTWAEFLRRNNDELVAGWGNLVNRIVSMAAKNIGVDPGRRAT